MSDTAIKVEGLGKEYVIGARERRSETFREMLMSSFSTPFGRLGGMNGNAAAGERFWALKDVSFEVKRGEVLGIIGRNGAGKSTLLKILSRITEPSEGRVTVRGRIASLLEVGTGFHPELTGRENIYLNGAILGMKRAEIERKFDEIVAFAEIDRFLDTPVKRYSSGMYVRLAFAVAAHLEPEILLVDEVLAVGDADFQRKCLGKMSEVAGGGRTVLFVSHNMPAVSSLCTAAILLNEGKIVQRGFADKVVEMYLGDRGLRKSVRGRSIDLDARVNRTQLDSAAAVSLEFDVTLRGALEEPRLGIGINDSEGRRIATIFTETAMRLPSINKDQAVSFRIATEPIRLSPGTIFVKVSLADRGHDIEVHDDALRLIVPEYAPFEYPPYGLPRGPILVTARVAIDEEICAITA